MANKPLNWHPRAREDVDETAAWHAQQGGLALELAFTAALEDAIMRLQRHPGVGSPRYALVLNLPGLRGWPLKRFPYLVFYVERDTRIDVLRVLHEKRDIPAWLGTAE